MCGHLTQRGARRHTVFMTDTAGLSSTSSTELTSVVVVGAGPAGLTVANILRAASVDCVVLETESREFIEQRPRAGFLEEWAVRALERRGLADRLLENAQVHSRGRRRRSGRW